MTTKAQTQRAAAKAVRKLDKLVEAAYYRRCQGIPVPFMKIPQIFAVGRKALTEGCSEAEMEERMVAYVETIREPR